MAFITIKITGDKETIASLQKLGKSLIMFKQAMKSIGLELEKFFGNQVYASQGGAIGQRWPALSDNYRKYKAKHYPGRATLVRTGEMKESYYSKATEQSVTIGNSAPQFPFHQSTEPRTKIPRRATMAATPEVKDICVRILEADISKKIRMAGF